MGRVPAELRDMLKVIGIIPEHEEDAHVDYVIVGELTEEDDAINRQLDEVIAKLNDLERQEKKLNAQGMVYWHQRWENIAERYGVPVSTAMRINARTRQILMEREVAERHGLKFTTYKPTGEDDQ